MSLRVLLVSVNFEDQPYPVYPVALDCLRSSLEGAGHRVRLWDGYRAQSVGPSLEDTLREFVPDVALVSIRNADNNDWANTKNYLPGALALIQAIRDAGPIRIVLGGSGYSLFPEEILRRSVADAGVMGPGEHVIVPLIEQLACGGGCGDLPGLVRREGDRCIVCPPDPPKTVAPVTSHDRDLVRFYWDRGGIPGIQLKRGCPFGCIYCTYPLLEGRTYLQKDASVTVDEMQWYYETCGVDQFFMVDSVLNAIPSLIRDFARELCRRRLPIRWSGYFMPKNITEADLALWKDAGLDGIEFGMDTLSEPLLERWGKGFRMRDVQQAIQACAAVDMPYSLYLIFGGPGETEATMEETIARAQAFPRAVVFAFAGMRIYPRTELQAVALASGMLRPDQDLLEPRFFLSPQLDLDRAGRRFEELGRQINWLIVGPSLQKKNKAAARLRSRGRKGALWQELMPR